LPLYEYRCLKCGALIEKIQKFSDPPLIKCEKCGGKLERLLSAPAIQFKGTGWYITDYARKSPPAESAEKSAAGSDKRPTASESDSKKKGTETAKTK
jgi:putative FmdB family regulatory protein